MEAADMSVERGAPGRNGTHRILVDAAGTPGFVQQSAARCFVLLVPARGRNPNHGEHDFGAVDEAGVRYFWKIEYYDRATEFGSPDPADPAVSTRVLTIMRADEY
jgi:hypothetical protein